MLNIVERELDARERAALSSGTQTKRPDKDLPTAATLLSKDSSPNCIYCDQSHSPSQCNVEHCGAGVGR